TQTHQIRHHRKPSLAAPTAGRLNSNPDEPEPLFSKYLISLKLPDDGHTLAHGSSSCRWDNSSPHFGECFLLQDVKKADGISAARRTQITLRRRTLLPNLQRNFFATNVTRFVEHFTHASRIDAVVVSDVVPNLTTPMPKPNIESFVISELGLASSHYGSFC
ncbi:MAG: hypothetical protein Q8M26_01240, partial [Pseudolabrys sp.]|nr:hypothetical protein [Pseudolabrys sp.]